MRLGSALVGAVAATAAMTGGQVALSGLNTAAPEHDSAQIAMTKLTASAQAPRALDGHFWADTRVNGAPVRMLVDTGATLVALTPADAEAVGLSLNTLRYSHPVDTAAGRVQAARVRLARLTVGDIARAGVDAIVVAGGLDHSLLGMSFLGDLRMETTPVGLHLSQ